MKVSPRPLSQSASKSRFSKHSVKSPGSQKLQSTFQNWEGKERIDYLERHSNSRSTVLLQEKKINRPNVNNYSETTLNSQVLRDSTCRESESRSRAKLTERGTNSKETTMLTTGSITSIPNKPAQVSIQTQLKELKALYEMKELEAKKLQENNDGVKDKIMQTSESILKQKQMNSVIQEKDRIIEKLKGKLNQVTGELEQLKSGRNNTLASKFSEKTIDTSQSAREYKGIVLKNESLGLKAREKKPSDLKFRTYIDALSQSELNGSSTLKASKIIQARSPEFRIAGNQSARSHVFEQNDNDNYLLNEHFGNKKKAALTSRNDYEPFFQTEQNIPTQNISRQWPANDSEIGMKTVSSEYQEISEEGRMPHGIQRVKQITNTHIYRRENSDCSLQNKQKSQLSLDFKMLMSKFSGLLDKYEKSEKQIKIKNKKLEDKLQELETL